MLKKRIRISEKLHYHYFISGNVCINFFIFLSNDNIAIIQILVYNQILILFIITILDGYKTFCKIHTIILKNNSCL